MTATLEAPRAVEAPEARPEGAPLPTSVLAELTLLGVSLATVVGYARLFDDRAFFLPIAFAAVGGHVLAALLRRIGLGPVLSTIAHLGLLPLVLTWTRYRDTMSYLLPSERTADRIGDDLAAAWDIFLDISAPVPAAPGFVVVAMAAAWIVALVADGLAFRLDATVEALAPATGLFLFASILADQEHRTVSAGVFVASVLAFTLAARVARASTTGRWLATDAGRGARSLLAVGAVLAVVAVVPALVAGPRLPGGDGEPVVDLDGEGGDSDRVTLSPLVDIRSRLVEQGDIQAFEVESAVPAYWRLTALDSFDGQIWSSSGSYVGVDGPLPSTPQDSPGATRLTQRFRIGALEQIWLPAAFEPISVDSPDADVDWDANSSSLVVTSDRETSDGLAYEVLSILPRVRPESLANGTAGLDREFLTRYTRLPDATLPVASRYSAQAVSGRTGAYEQALALQNWFRERFTYSLEVQPGHSTDALAAFLDPTGRVGYCEQFAGAYAALARALGLPARVAVGFTPGEPDLDDANTFVVRGRNAHAWPEVYFGGVGWVAFEPTPGRGAPGAETYTGVPFEQADPEEVVPTTTTAPAPITTGTAPDAQAPLDDPLPELTGGRPGDEDDGAVGVVVPILLVLAGAWLVGVPAAGVAARRLRHQRSRGRPDREVTDAWTDSVRALALVDLVPHDAETPTEFAGRAAADAGTDRRLHQELAELATAAAFGGGGTTPGEVERARRAAGSVVQRARRVAGPWRRFRAAVSPRRQLRAP